MKTFPFIDSHSHLFSDDPAVLFLLEEMNAKLLDICLCRGSAEEAYRQHAETEPLVRRHPDRFAFCGTFPWKDFEQPHYPDQVRAVIDDAKRRGAVAIKVWKDIGMECRDRAGRWVQVDHPAFQPVWERMIEHDLTLTAHLAEPIAAWSPLDESSPYGEYYRNHPEYHWHNRSDVPSHRDILDARDRMMEQNPRLRVVGCHLASLEWDTDLLAETLDRFPQLAVDTAARMPSLMLQNRDKVRSFFIRYQDRILYATDNAWGMRLFPNPQPLREFLADLRALWRNDLEWLTTDREVRWRDHAFRGLALPREVAEKVFYRNALRWYPGMDGNG